MYTLLKNSVITGDDALDEFPVKSHQINYYSLAMYTKENIENISKDKWLTFRTSTSLLCRLTEFKHNTTYSHTQNRGLIKFIENTKRALTIGTIRAIITISFIQ